MSELENSTSIFYGEILKQGNACGLAVCLNNTANLAGRIPVFFGFNPKKNPSSFPFKKKRI